MGKLLCGFVSSVRLLLGPEIFQPGDETELRRLNAGAGFVLKSYFPTSGGPYKVRSSFNTRDIRGRGGREPGLPPGGIMDTDEWPYLPPWS